MVLSPYLYQMRGHELRVRCFPQKDHHWVAPARPPKYGCGNWRHTYYRDISRWNDTFTPGYHIYHFPRKASEKLWDTNALPVG